MSLCDITNSLVAFDQNQRDFQHRIRLHRPPNTKYKPGLKFGSCFSLSFMSVLSNTFLSLLPSLSLFPTLNPVLSPPALPLQLLLITPLKLLTNEFPPTSASSALLLSLYSPNQTLLCPGSRLTDAMRVQATGWQERGEIV